MTKTKSVHGKKSQSIDTHDIHKIKHTLDPLRQVTFSTKRGCIGLWRRTLLLRYYVQVQSVPGFSVTWQDQGKGGRCDLTSDLDAERFSSEPIALPNNDVALTKVTIFFEGEQRLKITLYYSTFKVLVQGKSCSPWVDAEFFSLKTLVERLYDQHVGREAAVKAILSLPLPTQIQYTESSSSTSRALPRLSSPSSPSSPDDVPVNCDPSTSSSQSSPSSDDVPVICDPSASSLLSPPSSADEVRVRGEQ